MFGHPIVGGLVFGFPTGRASTLLPVAGSIGSDVPSGKPTTVVETPLSPLRDSVMASWMAGNVHCGITMLALLSVSVDSGFLVGSVDGGRGGVGGGGGVVDRFRFFGGVLFDFFGGTVGGVDFLGGTVGGVVDGGGATGGLVGVGVFVGCLDGTRAGGGTTGGGGGGGGTTPPGGMMFA